MLHNSYKYQVPLLCTCTFNNQQQQQPNHLFNIPCDLVVEAAFISDRAYSEDLDTMIHAHAGLMLNNNVERVRNKSIDPGYRIALHL